MLTAAGRDVYEPNGDGLSLNTYTGAEANSLDINGELEKLAWNVFDRPRYSRRYPLPQLDVLVDPAWGTGCPERPAGSCEIV